MDLCPTKGANLLSIGYRPVMATARILDTQ